MLKIGELAKRANVQVETIRYYEREGLLPAPARTEGNYRSYTPEHLERLSFIRHCRSLDMTLTEIQALLRFQQAPEKNCAGVNELLDSHIHHVAQRRVELARLEKQLRGLRRLCNQVQSVKACGILQELSLPPDRVRGDRRVHVPGAHRGGGRGSRRRSRA